jgi:hypothetical protein
VPSPIGVNKFQRLVTRPSDRSDRPDQTALEKTMKKVFVLASALGVVLALSPATRAVDPKPIKKSAAAPETVVYDASSAFEFLKTLAGNWERSGNEHGHEAKANGNTFRVSSAGSSVVETIYPGQANEMVTVYHMDGNDLLLTHYCALQNAPVMKFVKSNKPGEIKFAFHGGTNFDPKSDMHVHEGAFQVKDENTIQSAFVVYSEGKESSKAGSILKRAKTALPR